MNRWERPLLLFSLALNLGFVTLAAAHHRQASLPALLRDPDSPRAAALLQRWQQHRHEALARALDLDDAQRERFGGNFQAMRPALRAARREVMTQRLAYCDALSRGDAASARTLQGSLSQAQARVDSLCAELMIQESATLHPDQRQRYLQWMFRPGAGPGRQLGHGPGPGRMRMRDMPGTPRDAGPDGPPPGHGEAPPPGGPPE